MAEKPQKHSKRRKPPNPERQKLQAQQNSAKTPPPQKPGEFTGTILDRRWGRLI